MVGRSVRCRCMVQALYSNSVGLAFLNHSGVNENFQHFKFLPFIHHKTVSNNSDPSYSLSSQKSFIMSQTERMDAEKLQLIAQQALAELEVGDISAADGTYIRQGSPLTLTRIEEEREQHPRLWTQRQYIQWPRIRSRRSS